MDTEDTKFCYDLMDTEDTKFCYDLMDTKDIKFSVMIWWTLNTLLRFDGH